MSRTGKAAVCRELNKPVVVEEDHRRPAASAAR